MPVDHSTNILEIKNLYFSYQNEIILENINLHIHRGDFLGIIGPNGGGKTTLLKIMLGLLTPDSGEINLFNTPLSKFKDWFKITYIPQKVVNFDSNFPLSVWEVVEMGRFSKKGLLKLMDEKDNIIIKQSLEEVDMYQHKNKLISELSGGQQQRVFIARALASNPEIIFLDEPTVGVDSQTQDSFYKLLRKLNQNLNLTLVLVTHDIEMIANEATEIACVNKTLTYDNDPQKIIDDEKLKKVYGSNVKFVIHNH